jgi:hypothetical protein
MPSTGYCHCSNDNLWREPCDWSVSCGCAFAVDEAMFARVRTDRRNPTDYPCPKCRSGRLHVTAHLASSRGCAGGHHTKRTPLRTGSRGYGQAAGRSAIPCDSACLSSEKSLKFAQSMYSHDSCGATRCPLCPSSTTVHFLIRRPADQTLPPRWDTLSIMKTVPGSGVVPVSD